MMWLALAAALAACVQETPAPEEEPAAAPELLPLTVGLRANLWATSLDFEASTGAGAFQFDGTLLAGADVYGRAWISEYWAVEFHAEYGAGLDVEAIGGGASLLYGLPLQRDEWEAHVRGGLLFATLEMEDAPGDFSPAVGIESGLGMEWHVGAWSGGFTFGADVAVRYVRFDFDADAGVLEADEAVAGFGARLLLGAELRF